MSLFIRTDAAALGSTSCREEEGEARGMRSATTPSDATILLKPTDLQLFICLKIKIGVCAFGASRLSRGYVFRFTCVTADVRRSRLQSASASHQHRRLLVESRVRDNYNTEHAAQIHVHTVKTCVV